MRLKDHSSYRRKSEFLNSDKKQNIIHLIWIIYVLFVSAKKKNSSCQDDPSQEKYCAIYSRFGLCKKAGIRNYCKSTCGACGLLSSFPPKWGPPHLSIHQSEGAHTFSRRNVSIILPTYISSSLSSVTSLWRHNFCLGIWLVSIHLTATCHVKNVLVAVELAEYAWTLVGFE